MQYFIVIVSTFVFATLLSIMLFLKIMNKKVGRKFLIATAIMYVVTITSISLLGNSKLSAYDRINTWGILVTISAFIGVMVSLIKYHKRNLYISLGTLIAFFLISGINAVIADGWEMFFDYYCLMFEFNLVIFIITCGVKRNPFARTLGKSLVGLYVLHILLREIMFSVEIDTTIVEIIFFYVFGSIVGIPLYILIKKRVPKSLQKKKGFVQEVAHAEVEKNLKENTREVSENELADIVD